MLSGKVVFISMKEESFENNGQVIPYWKGNFELEGGKLLQDISIQKGAADGLKRFETVTGYFDYRQDGKKSRLIFTGYAR